MSKRIITWKEVYERVGALPVGKCYGIPRGGAIVAGLTGFAVSTIEEAEYIVDDIYDSGRTAQQYEQHGKPMHFLFDKRKEPNMEWLVLPWETKEENNDDAESCIARIIEYVGEDINREGLRDTPKRYIRALQEFLEVKNFNFTTFENEGKLDEMVIVDNIPFYSMCEHHLLPFFGVATVAYIPTGKIVGLSKLPRIVEFFSHKLQNQERITQQIGRYIEDELTPKGVAVSLRARHLCMEMRGVRSVGAHTTTQYLGGAFLKDEKTRAEFLTRVQ